MNIHICTHGKNKVWFEVKFWLSYTNHIILALHLAAFSKPDDVYKECFCSTVTTFFITIPDAVLRQEE